MRNIQESMPNLGIRVTAMASRRKLGKRATVAILVGVAAPVLTMALALGIEASSWTVTKLRLQRSADAAALAAAEAYMAGANAQNAATYGAYVAEINNGTGTTNRTWTAASQTLSDNMITIQLAPGPVIPTDTAFVATVQTVTPLLFAGIVLNTKTKSISANATAEIGQGPTTGGQPCITTLEGDDDESDSGTGLNLSGNVNLTASGCTVRSNDGISISGHGSLDASALYASGAIGLSGNVTVNDNNTEKSHQPQIPDPYKTWSPVQDNLKNASCQDGETINVYNKNITLSPGCYQGINASGNSAVTMQSGNYYINGGINLSGNVKMNGSDVAIFSTGIFGTSGNVNVSLSAPRSGQCAGIAYASNSSEGSSFSGNQSIAFTGLVYYPNGGLNFSGNAGSDGCAEIVAKTANLSGNVKLAVACTTYSLPTYGSVPGTNTAALVR